MATQVTWTEVPAPVCEVPPKYPHLTKEVYDRRLARLRARMKQEGLDAVVVYADREHAANFSYLTGFGPRFEEALLIVLPEGTPTAVLGAENVDMVHFTPVELKGVFYPTFGLMGQPRVNVPALEQILREAGLERGMRVGTVGWKYYTEADGCPPGSIEIPHFIVEALQAVGAEVRNGTQLFMSPRDGLRTVLDAEEIVAYEYAACLVARSILRVMDEAAPGKTEMELAAPMQNMGLPLSVHPMLSVGEKARFGLTSPTDRVAARGDFLTTAYGIEGALTCRAAFLAAGPQDLAPEIRDWLERIAMPFYTFAARWLGEVGIGVSGGHIWNLAESLLPRAEWGWVLNPGHLIGVDEWISTPFTEGSDVQLQSGNYIQLDLIIIPKPPYFGADLEDGIVLADEALRRQLEREYPDLWARFTRRREYLRNVLGIELGEDVLPMSDLLGYYRPFLLTREKALVVG
ncbi:MAG: aminopeptidase P family N-terminal domain-containing protein [Limnochorda sp.]|uniref:M24 family metallopeptidase n=2 Tax=Limnochordaceae TaxID=1676650 RepID=UPI001D5C2B7F|nr:hypothetical protein [Bacillota bacterium]MBO2519969.1 hypothetical protein [Bacillota bacterium]